MRILKDFKIPNFKLKKIEMNDIPDIEKVKIDYEKVKEAGEKKNKKQPYDAGTFTTVKEIFVESMKKYADNTLVLQKPSHKELRHIPQPQPAFDQRHHLVGGSGLSIRLQNKIVA